MVVLIKHCLAVATALTFSLNVLGVGVAESYKVDSVRADASGKGFVKFDSKLKSEGELPTCGNSYAKHLAFDLNTEAGHSIFALVLAAQASGQSIYAKGKGECDVYTVVESWAWGKVE